MCNDYTLVRHWFRRRCKGRERDRFGQSSTLTRHCLHCSAIWRSNWFLFLFVMWITHLLTLAHSTCNVIVSQHRFHSVNQSIHARYRRWHTHTPHIIIINLVGASTNAFCVRFTWKTFCLKMVYKSCEIICKLGAHTLLIQMVETRVLETWAT